MAKIQILKDFRSDQTVYPRTCAEAVLFNNGETAQRRVDAIVEALSQKAGKDELSNVIAVDAGGAAEVLELPGYRRLFVEMFNEAATVNGKVYGKYDPENAPDAEHPFVLNGLWLTWTEAMHSYRRAAAPIAAVNQYYFSDAKLRTNFPYPGLHVNYTKADSLFSQCANLEVAVMSGHMVSTGCFHGCAKLRYIYGAMYSDAATKDMFAGCESLEYIENFRRYRASGIDLSDSPRFTNRGVEQLMAFNTDMTITLHPEAYARVTDAMFEEAASKNITIVTT